MCDDIFNQVKIWFWNSELMGEQKKIKPWTTKFNFIDLLLAVLGLCCRTDFSLVAASGGAALCREGSLLQWCLWQSVATRAPRLQCLQPGSSVVEAPRLWGTDSVAVEHGLTRSMACGILPDQGSNPGPLHWWVDSLLLSHQGSPKSKF